MKLIAGERFRLHDDNIYIKLVSDCMMTIHI